jgi:PTH1 family peptidyl-tRNA hydrolase
VKIVVGLGNPGPKYKDTRHNIGFMVLDCLAAALGAEFAQEKHGGLIAKAQTDNGSVLLVKPLTYMNKSGDCVAMVVRYTSANIADTLVVMDDVNLPLGRLRFRQGGSSGGHNGLKSIIERLGGQDFPRLRIGVGLGDGGRGLVNHVLGSFAAEERPQRDEAVERAAKAVQVFLNDGVEKAMNAFNREAPETT